MTNQINVTISGATLPEVIENAKKFINAAAGTNKTTTTTKPGKRAAAVVETEDDEELGLDGEETEETESDDELSFDGDDEEAEETPAPARSKKLTDKDVNAQVMKFAKKHGRPKAAALLLKKFKAKSIAEMKPAQYAAAIAAFKV